jgi:hypothetical protein
MEIFCYKCGASALIEPSSTNLKCGCELFSTDITYLFIDRSQAVDWDLIDILPPNCMAFTRGGNKTVNFFDAGDHLDVVAYTLNSEDLETLN